MLYFLQTAVHEDKHLNKGLLNIYGVGKHIAKISVLQYGLLDEAKGKDLRRLHRLQLKSHFDDYPLELASDLKEIYKNNCQRLIDIQSYKGRRHKGRYPVRGQRTHTNAKTQKRLYKRWLINTYEKTKPLVNQKKTNNIIKPKKSKVSKPKPSNKTKTKAPKASKYKI